MRIMGFMYGIGAGYRSAPGIGSHFLGGGGGCTRSGPVRALRHLGPLMMGAVGLRLAIVFVLNGGLQ